MTVIDLARLVVGHCSYAFSESEKKRKFFATLFEAAEWTSRWTVPVPKSRETNGLLMLRGLANAFKEDTDMGDSLWAKDVRVLVYCIWVFQRHREPIPPEPTSRC